MNPKGLVTLKSPAYITSLAVYDRGAKNREGVVDKAMISEVKLSRQLVLTGT